ncbi:Uncharacterised protein [Chlamydia trachomatis]|nr:Uncharacterised protein [Chlamydia trachomatis]
MPRITAVKTPFAPRNSTGMPLNLPGLSEFSTTVLTTLAGTIKNQDEIAKIIGATKSMCSSLFWLYHSIVANAEATTVNKAI